MQREVIHRLNQSILAEDLNNAQTYAHKALTDVVHDAISDGVHYSGGLVTAQSATDVAVSPVRLYQDGVVFVAEQITTKSLFQYLPSTTKKIVAIVVWGSEIETEMTSRGYIIDPVNGVTEAHTVPMTRLRLATVDTVGGTESADPQPPILQSSVLPIAYVTLLPSGIESVQILTGNQLPNLDDHEGRVSGLETWQSEAAPRIGALATDLAALNKRTQDLATRQQFESIAADTARVKEKLNLPTSYAAYDADYFVTATKSNPAGVGYGATIDGGLLFPNAAQATAPLAPFNPYESSITRSVTDLVLPKYTEIRRIDNRDGESGELALNSYQVASQTIKSYTETKWELTYGYRWNFHVPWWMGPYIIYAPLFPSLWFDVKPTVSATRKPVTTYELQASTESYTASMLSRNFLVSNSFWCTSMELFFTDIGPSGDVTIVISETVNGQPDPLKTLARTNILRTDLKLAPLATRIPISPVLLEAGKRYSFSILTGGAHKITAVDGNRYNDGTMFYQLDGNYFMADPTKDIKFSFFGAQFDKPRTELLLQNVTLAGGITDLKIQAQQVVPDGTSLEYEFNLAGVWYRATDQSVNRLAAGPEILPLRAVFLGTSDMAPALRLASNAVIGSRSNTVMVHWSTTRTLAAATTSITLQAAVANWIPADHTLLPVIKVASTDYTPGTTVQSTDPDGLRRFRWTFTVPSTTAYEIKLTGTRTSGARPFQVLERIDVAA